MTSRSVRRLSEWINSPLVQLLAGTFHWSVRVWYTRYLSLNIGLRQHYSDIRQSGKSVVLKAYSSLLAWFILAYIVVLYSWSHSLKYMRLSSYESVSLNIVGKNCSTSVQVLFRLSLTIQCDLWRFIEPHMEGDKGHCGVDCLLVWWLQTDTVNKIPTCSDFKP